MDKHHNTCQGGRINFRMAWTAALEASAAVSVSLQSTSRTAHNAGSALHIIVIPTTGIMLRRRSSALFLMLLLHHSATSKVYSVKACQCTNHEMYHFHSTGTSCLPDAAGMQKQCLCKRLLLCLGHHHCCGFERHTLEKEFSVRHCYWEPCS